MEEYVHLMVNNQFDWSIKFDWLIWLIDFVSSIKTVSTKADHIMTHIIHCIDHNIDN